MIVSCIRDLNLHDSELLEVVVKKDEVVMVLDYIEDYETTKCSVRRLIFRGCTEATFRLNPHDASPNSIQFGDETPFGTLRKIRIETNTVQGAIEITAAEIELR